MEHRVQLLALAQAAQLAGQLAAAMAHGFIVGEGVSEPLLGSKKVFLLPALHARCGVDRTATIRWLLLDSPHVALLRRR